MVLKPSWNSAKQNLTSTTRDPTQHPPRKSQQHSFHIHSSHARYLTASKHLLRNTSSSLSFLPPPFFSPFLSFFKWLTKRSHHMRYHEKSKKCETCDKSFGTITHLERHVNSAHLSTKGFYCTAAGCKYSKTVPSPEFFSRKDNWRRHMRDKHGWSWERGCIFPLQSLGNRTCVNLYL